MNASGRGRWLRVAALLAALVSPLARAADRDANELERLFRDGMTAPQEDRLRSAIEAFQTILANDPSLHRARLELAVAYYRAGRLGDVMLPLGKAMTLRFPMNELCLNLLACLSAAKHYPEQAAGLLDQAGYGCPHPVVFRNRELLKAWLAGGGDLKGVRLCLEPEYSAFL